MRAIGNNLVIKKIEKPNKTTKGGLILSEKQREDIRIQKAEVVKTGFNVKHVKEKDIIYFDKSAAHKIEIDKESYHVIKEDNVVVVL